MRKIKNRKSAASTYIKANFMKSLYIDKYIGVVFGGLIGFISTFI